MNTKSLDYFIEEKKKILKKVLLQKKKIDHIPEVIYNCLKKGNKLLLCGNGGSAADAQHLAAEFIVRLRPGVNRKPFAAISLAQDTSTLTACGNDFSFNDIYSRNLEALGKKNDLLIAISTSGNSKNVLNALKQANRMSIKTIGLLGSGGGKAKKLCNYSIIVPSRITARIQEVHIFLGHYIFEKVENLMLKK